MTHRSIIGINRKPLILLFVAGVECNPDNCRNGGDCVDDDECDCHNNADFGYTQPKCQTGKAGCLVFMFNLILYDHT